MTQKAEELIDGFIAVWKKNPDFKIQAAVLGRKKPNMIDQVQEILNHKKKGDAKKYDEARAFICKHVALNCEFKPREELFVKENVKDRETIEIILDEAFYDYETDSYIFSHSEKIAQIIFPCISLKKDEVILDFYTFFFGHPEKCDNADSAERYKTMLWFAYLLIELAQTDRKKVCTKGKGYFQNKLKLLLDHAVNEKIIIITDETGKGGYDGGMWEGTLFGWLQPEYSEKETRKRFLQGLIERFNFDNKRDHVNRKLLSKHRKCMYQNAFDMFYENNKEQLHNGC
ncbi:hypothetical protein QUF75_13885 [Desulfococcaceae bacterium HSG7]|nr:hypothetical protein [Desulfococcaceae bacterium HSG7]